MAMTLILRAFTRHLSQHPWQLALALIGIAVGVAVVVSIRLTQFSAVAAFDSATQTTIGTASHRVINSNGRIRHSDFIEFQRLLPTTVASPVLQSRVTLPDHGDREILLFGIDPIARADLGENTDEPIFFNPTTLMSEIGATVISATTAQELTLELGDTVTVERGKHRRQLTVSDIAPSAGSPGGIASNLLLVDISSAQEVLGVFDEFDYFDLKLEDDNMRAAVAKILLSDAFSQRFTLVDLSAETLDMKRMTDAFYTNLTALSLMALLVGMFLIYNTETFLVVQRRQIFGRLRALGVARRQLLSAILLEAVCLGIAGSFLGVAAGVLLAHQLLDIVARTVNDLYYEASAQELVWSSPTLLGCFALGVAATLLAALIPALQATHIEPTMAMRANSSERKQLRRQVFVLATIFVVANGFAYAVLQSSYSINAAFVAIAILVCGFAALCPVVLRLLAVALHKLSAEHQFAVRYGASSTAASLHRSATACAALAIATAASIGIGIMVGSFRVAVSDWLDSALRADIYIADSRFDQHLDREKISKDVAASIAQIEGIAALSTVTRIETYANQGRVQLSAFSLSEKAKQGFGFIAGEAQAIWAAWDTTDAVLVTEPYAHRNKIAINDILTIETERGAKPFTVRGIYRDYASERGSISISQARFGEYWSARDADSLAVYGSADTNISQLEQRIDNVLATHPQLATNASTDLKIQSLSIFDRTFLITELLRIIAIAVSFVGVLGALMAQQLEKTHEYGLLRALGFNHGEIFRSVTTQTLLLGIAAVVIAVPLGLLLGSILIHVINPRSFGWTMTMTVDSATVLLGSLVAIVAAFAAGIYPSVRAMRIEPASAMRFE